MLVGGWITQILSQWIGDVSGMVYELLQDPPIFLMGKKTGNFLSMFPPIHWSKTSPWPPNFSTMMRRSSCKRACLICRKSEIFLRESNNDGNEDWWGYNGDVMIFTIFLWYFMIRVWKCGIVPAFFYRQLRKMIIEHKIGDGLIPLKPQIWKEWTK